MNERNKKLRLLYKNIHLVNHNGKIKTTSKDTYGTQIHKLVEKKVGDKVYVFKVVYEIRSHKISLPFDEKKDVRELLRYGKTIAKEMLENELQEVLEEYINITLKDVEINYLYTDKWMVLTKSDGTVYQDIDGNVVLIKYYRITPSAEFLSQYYSTDELSNMENKIQ